jgi:hypothetical protein
MDTANRRTGAGMGVDTYGNAVIDPTQNVISLVAAEKERADDLRRAYKEITDVKITHQKELGDLRAQHQSDLRKAESERLDAIRQVDREDVTKTAAQAMRAIETLAATTNTTAETLRSQVAATASAAAVSLANSMGEVNKRLSALELAGSEGKGKQTVADPMLVELVAEVKSLRTAGDATGGRTEGAKNLWGYIVGGIGLLVLILKALGKI